MYRLHLPAIILLTSLFTYSAAQAEATGKELYQLYCAGCHGKNLEGVNGRELRKTDWIYGRAPSAMLQTILYGLPGTEMVGWNGVLSRDQAILVRDFIIQQQDVRPDANRPLPERIEVGGRALKIEVLVSEGLNTPWGIEFVDERRALITERTGGLRWLVDGKLDPRPIRDIPEPILYADSGMMDVALDPKFEKTGWVYIALSHPLEKGRDKASPGMTKVIRGRIKKHRWVDEEPLFERPAEEYLTNVYRWGCRLLFDRDGYLYFTVGDHARNQDVQNLSKPSGKIYRIHRDGRIPQDNPFVALSGAIPAIYTIGNRNAQGLTQHPVTGEIWATEHGPMGGDELNILRPGANYGWPLVTYGLEYDGSIVSHNSEQLGIEPPIIHWTPSIAVCPAEFYTGTLFPEWRNHLLVGALAYEELRLLKISNHQVVSQEILLKNYGRVRDIKTGPDGAIYLLLNQPDLVVRINPAD